MIEFTKIQNWKLYKLQNKFLELLIVPELGGRLLQLQMDGHDYFFVNPQLIDIKLDTTRLGENGSWLNFGGEKIWPAPQGWGAVNQWAGPPDPILDSGVYDISEEEGKQSLILTSPFDPHTGIQIEKKVQVSNTESKVSVQTIFFNKTEKEIEWSIWPVIQMNTSQGESGRYKVFCPVREESQFKDGYKVMHGLVNNPQYKINENKCLEISYDYIVGKVGLDTDSDWAAYLDTELGKVLILNFQPEIDKCYPENTSIQFWTAGRGYIYSRSKLIEHQNDKIQNPAYLEMELLSPIQKIKPQESIHFDYQMRTCTIPSQEKIVNVNSCGVIASYLAVTEEGDDIGIKGKYGAFVSGSVKLYLEKEDMDETELYTENVSPFKGIDINVKVKREMILSRSSLILKLYDDSNSFIGEIDKLII